jgi:hypothetical protein
MILNLNFVLMSSVAQLPSLLYYVSPDPVTLNDFFSAGLVPWLCNKLTEALPSKDMLLLPSRRMQPHSCTTSAVAHQIPRCNMSFQLCLNILHTLVRECNLMTCDLSAHIRAIQLTCSQK